MDVITCGIVWNKLNELNVTSTEAFILVALALFTSDTSGCCHPTQERIVEKTHLSLSTVKDSLASLKAKGLVSWNVKKAHVNEYSITLDADRASDAGAGSDPCVDGAQADDHADIPDRGCIPTKEQYLRLKEMYDEIARRAVFLLAWDFCQLDPDKSDVAIRLFEYKKLIEVRQFGPCQDVFFGLRSRFKQHEIDATELRKLITEELTAVRVIGETDFTWTVR